MTTTNIIYATKDTFISGDSPDLNFGNDLSLFLSSKEKSKHAFLIYFDLSALPANALITAASLELSLFRNDNTQEVTLNIKQLPDSFYEYTATEANFLNGKNPIPLVEGDNKNLKVSPPTTDKPLASNPSLVFTGLHNTVSKWYNDSASNFGLLIYPSDETLPIAFWSREYSDNDLRPSLQIEYTINTSISNIETIVSTQDITPTEAGNQTTIYDISKDLFFNYSIYNPQTSPANVTVQSSNNKTGPFTSIGNPIVCLQSTALNKNSVLVEVLPLNKYVCLSVQGTGFSETDTVQISATHKTFANMVSSQVSSANVSEEGDSIVLSMTKGLTVPTESLANLFEYSISSDPKTIHNPNAIEISGTKISLNKLQTIPEADKVTLTYTASETAFLTGENGAVDNFTNMRVFNKEPKVISGDVVAAGDFIELQMDRPLTDLLATPTTAFTVTSSSKTAVNVTNVTVLGKSVTLAVDIIRLGDVITLTYKANKTTTLAGPTGTVADFTSQAITNNSAVPV